LGVVAFLDRLAERKTPCHAGEKFTGGKFKKGNGFSVRPETYPF
jgi:hypothetical protein